MEARATSCHWARQFRSLDQEVAAAEKLIHAWHQGDETGRRLEAIPGIGVLTASALTASVSDPSVFRSGSGSGKSPATSGSLLNR